MRLPLSIAVLLLLCSVESAAQEKSAARQLPARRTAATFKIDGLLDEAAWKEATPASHFVEWTPNAGQPEAHTNRTIVYLLYDNTSIYIGGYCYESTRDSVSSELVGRDIIGVNDFVGVIFDTYNDKINGFGFYVTPLGEQFDAKYSNTAGEDGSWNGVWDSEARLHDDGWSFEMRIPYSALRFSSAPLQTWGLNITRRRKKSGQQYMWSPVDQKIENFMSQEGSWTGIENIQPPLRLSLSPYFSAYINHYPAAQKEIKAFNTSINGGMDLKYGISQSFTLDMTLIPDFGQVQSDNQVLNLSPFEVKYNENRSFFTEGTELFSKGDLFYSRRIGSQPLHYWDVLDSTSGYPHMNGNEKLLKNPTESKLVNATKISGRTKKGLGVGFFNAITKPMYATVEDELHNVRKIQTAPLTNYNIVVLDQTLKNNSSVSFINTNVLRSGSDYDANVSAFVFNLNNKKNTYALNGNTSVSMVSRSFGKHQAGYAHALRFGKTGGNFLFNLSQELYDDKYDKNDMGILFNNNYIEHYLWAGYRILKPKGWYNRIQFNYNGTLSRRYKPGDYQIFYTNVNANVQFKSLWWAGVWVGLNARGNDFYEPRQSGRFYKSPKSWRFNVWAESNSAKRYYISAGIFAAYYDQFGGRLYDFNVQQRYRFNSRFSLSHDLYGGPARNDAGYYTIQNNEVIFSRRDRNTVENVLRVKYSFNNRSGITFRARHYWSQVRPQQLLDLKADGTLTPTLFTDVAIRNQNINFFNIDAVYTLQFAPGSFINVVWKNAIYSPDEHAHERYFKNFARTIDAPQNNNLSIKILYYLDYLDLKKGKRDRGPKGKSNVLENQ